MKTDWLTREQYDWLLDNLAAPDAPPRWFNRFQMTGPVAWARGSSAPPPVKQH